MVDTVSSIEKSALAQLLGCQAEKLPASFDLSASACGQSRSIGKLVWVSRHYQIKLVETRLPDAWFHEDIEIGFGRYGQTLYVPEQLISLGPDAESPWVFENARPVARLRAAGSCRIKDESCIFAVPERACLLGNEVCLGQVGDRVIYSDSSPLIHVSIGPLAFKIECHVQVMPDASDRPRWSGLRLYEASNPALVFVQKPSLPATSAFRVNESDLFWNCAGSTASLSGSKPLGLGSLIHKKDGVIQSRQRVVCLPEGAGIEIRPSFTPGQGQVVLKNWPAQDVSSSSAEVTLRAQRNGNDWLLDVQASVMPPPADFPLTVFWPGGKQELPRVPFPVEDVFFSRADGSAVAEEKMMRLDMLGEIKANLLTSSKNPRWTVTLILESDGGVNGYSKQIHYRGSHSIPLREIRFFELVDHAKKLMSMSSDLDARIAVSVECRGKVLGRLRFTRYQYAIEPNFQTGLVTLAGLDQQISVDLLDKARLKAIHLVDQGNRYELSPILSEGVPVGSWDFQPELRTPGYWLIYPAKESQIDFRPVAWNVPEVFASPTKKFDGLRGILSLADRKERMEALVARLNWLADNPGDGDWDVIQDYVNAIGHVPLACFDTWVTLARCPAAMAMAILRLDGFDQSIACRICDELPFEWMLVSPAMWRNAICKLKAHIVTEGGSDRALRAFRNEIEEKTERLRRSVPSLEFSLNFALCDGLGVTPTRLDVRKLLAAPDALVVPYAQSVMQGEGSAVQHFLQRAALQDEGPTLLKYRVIEYSKVSEYKTIFSSFRIPSDDWKYSLVMTPFMVAEDVIKGDAACWLENPGLLHAVREYHDFDPEWFDDAYQLAAFISYSINRFQEQ